MDAKRENKAAICSRHKSIYNDVTIDQATFKKGCAKSHLLHTAMTTFSSPDFNADNYRDFRPSYAKHLYKLIYDFHISNGGVFEKALDVGTGEFALNAAKMNQ